MTATTIIDLPKNKTGIFAGDTLQEAKPIRNQSNPIVSSQPYRPTDSVNLLLTSIKQNRIPPYTSIDGHSSTTNDSCSTINGIRNGFRPSTIRRQKSRLTTAMTHREKNERDLKEISVKQAFTPSIASARLKSEIDLLNNQLKVHGDVNKILRPENNREMNGTPQSVLSYSTSCRLSSASTSHTIGRTHQRFPSAMTNGSLNTLVSIPGFTDASNKSPALPCSPYSEEYIQRYEINHHTTHAYQIPQQSNVGSESIFPLNPPILSTNRTQSAKTNRRSYENKPVLCPFYVMYFTNLAMQQRPNTKNENKRISSSISTATATTRKGTASSRYQSTRRQVHSPISMNTYSTIDDDDDNDSVINATSYYNNKRFSAKMTAFENENSHLLKDILRTTSWNHVQV